MMKVIEKIDFLSKYTSEEMEKVDAVRLDEKTFVSIDCVSEIIDKATADYEALPTEIDVGREKAVISFEKKDGMLAMASIIRALVLALKEGDKE